MKTAWIVAAGLVCAAAPAGWGTAWAQTTTSSPDAARQCTLAPAFKNARRLIYTFNSRTEVLPPPPASKGDGEAAVTPARVYTTDLTLRLTVLGVDEHGAASFAMLIDRAEVTTNEGDREQTGVFTREEAEKAEPLAENAPLEQRLALLLAKAAARLDVRADGTVTLVQGLEEAQALAKAQGTEGSRQLGPLAAGAERRTLSMLFRVDAPGEDGGFPARAPGASWELVDRVPLLAVADLVLTTSLKLESCTAEEARIVGAVRTSVEPQKAADDGKAPDPTSPSVEVTEQTDELSISWNPGAGALRLRERNSYLSLVAQLGETRRHIQTIRTRSTIKLVELTDP